MIINYLKAIWLFFNPFEEEIKQMNMLKAECGD